MDRIILALCYHAPSNQNLNNQPFVLNNGCSQRTYINLNSTFQLASGNRFSCMHLCIQVLVSVLHFISACGGITLSIFGSFIHFIHIYFKYMHITIWILHVLLEKKSLWIANLNLLCMIIIDSGQDNRNEVCIVNKPKLAVHDHLQRTSLLGIPHELIFHLCSTHVKTIPQISAIFVCHHCQN